MNTSASKDPKTVTAGAGGTTASKDPATQQVQQPVTQTPVTQVQQPVTQVQTPSASKDPKVAKLGADDDLPEDADLIQLPKKALTERLNRAGKKELNALFEAFGVKDRPELEAKLGRLKEFEDKAEEQRLAQLSNEEKLAEEKARVEAERDQWKTRYEQQVTGQQIEMAQGHVSKLAEKYLDPDYIETELPRLSKHLTSNYTDKQLEDLPDSVIEQWFEDRVKEKPKLAKDFTGETVEKRPLSTGKKDEERPAPKTGEVGPKNFKPQKGETPEQRRAINAEIKDKLGVSF